jgi:hypothetical protein
MSQPELLVAPSNEYEDYEEYEEYEANAGFFGTSKAIFQFA